MTEPDRSRRPKDSLDRKPFERLPWWVRLVSSLPFSFWYGFSTLCALLGEYVLRYRREVIDMQIRRCFPEFDDAAVARTRRGFYSNFMDVMVESIKGQTMSGEELDRRVELVGMDLVRGELRAGRIAILATSHVCNWEWTLQAVSKNLGFPLDAAYKPLHNEFSDRLFLTLRSRFGATMVPDRRVPRHTLRRRREPRVLAMVADQDPTLASARHVATFFGQETTFYYGPEAIARVVGGPLYYVAVERTRRGHYRAGMERLVAHNEDLPEGAMTDRYAARVEAQIRAHPPDWLWAYRRWKKRRRKPADDGAGPGDP